MDITPTDDKEKKVVGAGQRIAAAIGLISAAAPAIIAAVGGTEAITNNIGLLSTGLGSLVAGGIASYVAVRRMAKK